MSSAQIESTKLSVGNVLLEFGMIDSLLRSVYKSHKGIDPVAREVSDKELDESFYDYVGLIGLYDAKSKAYIGEDSKPIHLRELMQRIRHLRNVAAHQTWSLVTGLSALPAEAHGQASDSYIGSIEEFEKSWKFYSEQFLPIFEGWNSCVFDEMANNQTRAMT